MKLKMIEFIDQIGHKVVLNKKPERIVSLVPSQTELLVDLGLSEALVGITKFCVRPLSLFKTKTRVGGTKSVDFKIIKEVNPDLIVANKEENEKEQIEHLQDLYPVWTSDVRSLNQAFDMIKSMGILTNTNTKSEKIIQQIRANFSSFNLNIKNKSCVYLIWHNPIMTINQDTFIHSILENIGFVNLLSNEADRYPSISIEQLRQISPDILLLSSEPFPFKEKHIEFYKRYLPKTKIKLVDGEMFSWYGSRLIQAPEYFYNLC